MTSIGYVRTSDGEHGPAQQRQQLLDAGCTRVFEDVAAHGKHDRPGLAAALEQLTAGDVLVIWRLDRLGRSLGHLVRTVSELGDRGVGFRSLEEDLETSGERRYTAAELFRILSGFEEHLIRERTRPGLVAAMSSPRPSGRKPSITASMLQQAKALVAEGLTVREAAARIGVGKTTLYDALKPDHTPAADQHASGETPSSADEAAAAAPQISRRS